MREVRITANNWLSWILVKLFEKRIVKYVAWENYEIGFTGHGPTAFDSEPEFPKPWIPKTLRRQFAELREAEARLRRVAWDASVLKVTGEFPKHWEN